MDGERAAADTRRQLAEFVAVVTSAGLPAALVTSGGTTAPLERRTVRFLDNVSTGRRGAACTEHLLSAGYAVCLLWRRGSVAPYERHVSPAAVLQHVADPAAAPLAPTMAALAAEFVRVRAAGLLLTLPFTSVTEYLRLLETASRALAPLDSRLLVLLAAAVSDYHLPEQLLSEHKLSSSAERLTLSLQPVPKAVGQLRREWCPLAFVVTFKLETEPEQVVARSRAALDKYGHRLVVGNVLQTRRRALTLVTLDDVTEVTCGPAAGGDDGPELEARLVEEVAARHGRARQETDTDRDR